MFLNRLQHLVHNTVDNYWIRLKESLPNMNSPYLDRPLRSVAEAEAERSPRSSEGYGGAGCDDRAGMRATGRGRPAGGVLARLGKAMIRPIHGSLTVFTEDDYG